MVGIIQSLDMQNKKADEERKELEVVWQHADISLTASRF